MSRIGRFRKGRLAVGRIELRWELRKRESSPPPGSRATSFSSPPYCLHIGPGPQWRKPNPSWLTVDVDPSRADIVVNFNSFDRFPLGEATVDAIYASHVFEHISIYRCPRVLADCYRVLTPNGVLRIVVPDVAKSVEQYVAGNDRFPLFERRRSRAADAYGEAYTLFECMKEEDLLGEQLAHQNAWDFESLRVALMRAGFRSESVHRSAFRASTRAAFDFEGTYASEANEDYRSLYVEASK
jgi:predicted SAM-dependent methyltransferase